jgi:hypothetical protein
MATWRCYYTLPDGQLLRDQERHESEIEALLWSQIIESDPDDYYFRAKSGEHVPARQVVDSGRLSIRAVRRRALAAV